MSKVCTKCGVEKPLSEFYRKKTCRDGLSSSCKECVSELARIVHYETIGRARFLDGVSKMMCDEELLSVGLWACNKCEGLFDISSFQKVSRGAYCGRTRECNNCRAKRASNERKNNPTYKKTVKIWRDKNRDRLNEQARKHRADNPDVYKEYYNNRKNTPERYERWVAWRREYESKNKEKISAKNKKWREENREKYREYQRKRQAQQRELTAIGRMMDLQEYMENELTMEKVVIK